VISKKTMTIDSNELKNNEEFEELYAFFACPVIYEF
jgi:hypothetical protein